MHFDQPIPDGFEVDHPRITAEVGAHPGGRVAFEGWPGLHIHRPVIDRTTVQRGTHCMPHPGRRAADDGHVRADMCATQQRHPEMAGGLLLQVFLTALQRATAVAHAAQVDDRLAENRIAGWLHSVRRAGETLGFGQRQLVINPPIIGMAPVGIRVIGRYMHIRRARYPEEILQAPRIIFINRHGLPLTSDLVLMQLRASAKMRGRCRGAK